MTNKAAAVVEEREPAVANAAAFDERKPSIDERKPSIGRPTFTFALFSLAFVLRLGAAFMLAGEPVWDGHYYDFGARRIAEGHGYSDDRVVNGITEWHPWCHYPVGYSGYLAFFYKVFGASATVAHVANALAGGLLPVIVFFLAREVLSERRARIAGALVALHPGLVLYGALVMSEPLSALLVMASFLAAVRGARVRGVLTGVVAGALVLGVAALVRPQALLCAPFLALVAAKDGSRASSSWMKKAKLAVVACVVALLPVLPWTARNCKVMDGCALVSTNAGWNLAIGAFPRATGRFETLRSSDGCREVTGQVQQDRCWLGYGLTHIRESPGRWLGLIPAKLGFTFDHESFAVEYLREARPSAWPEDRRVLWRSIITTAHRLLVAASALGFVALARPKERTRTRLVQNVLVGLVVVGAFLAFTADTPIFWPIVVGACLVPWLPLPGRPAAPAALLLPVVVVLSTVVAHAIFFGEDRYHIVVTPALCLLAAAALRLPKESTPKYSVANN